MEKYVLVTTDTDKRGVFVGELQTDNSPDYVVLTNARMIVYYPPETRGVLGLAQKGALPGSRVSYSVSKIKIFGVTAVVEMDEKCFLTFGDDKWTR